MQDVVEILDELWALDEGRCAVSARFLASGYAATLQLTAFNTDFLATSHSFPTRAFSLVMLQLLQVLSLLNLNVCHTYIYTYIDLLL